MCAMKSGMRLALLTLLKDNAKLAAGVPSCRRVASQWTVVFTEQCTSRFPKEDWKAHHIPAACEQGFIGGVAVDTFPWNNEVIVVDNEEALDSFDLQPSQEVSQHGAGVVILQTTRDMTEKEEWHVRNSSIMAEMVHPHVDYLTSEDEKYVKLDVLVHFAPRNARGNKTDIEREEPYKYDNEYDNDTDASLDDHEFSYSYEFEEGVPAGKGVVGRHHPRHSFSYELEESYDFVEDHKRSHPHHHDFSYDYSYDFSYDYSFDYTYDYSFDYSFEFGENTHWKPHYVRTATSLDVYVCSEDDDDDMEELSFYCDPYHGGTEQCYAEASTVHVGALSIHHMKMYCEPECLSDGTGGIWCDIFDLDGCRMCSEDCSSLCEGDNNCQCVQCSSNDLGGEYSPPPIAPQPTSFETPSPTIAGSSMWLETTSPENVETRSPEHATNFAPTTSKEMMTFAPTTSNDFVEIPMISAAPTSGAPVECTPGDADSCYDQLSTLEWASLESRSRGLTCEESCITDGGLWCDALGRDGCRFCAFSCEDYCTTNGLSESCECFEC